MADVIKEDHVMTDVIKKMMCCPKIQTYTIGFPRNLKVRWIRVFIKISLVS